MSQQQDSPMKCLSLIQAIAGLVGTCTCMYTAAARKRAIRTQVVLQPTTVGAGIPAQIIAS